MFLFSKNKKLEFIIKKKVELQKELSKQNNECILLKNNYGSFSCEYKIALAKKHILKAKIHLLEAEQKIETT